MFTNLLISKHAPADIFLSNIFHLGTAIFIDIGFYSNECKDKIEYDEYIRG